MDKTNTQTDVAIAGHNVLAERSSASLNKKRASDDTIDQSNIKKPKKTTVKRAFDLSSVNPPSFMKDIVLPDEDEVEILPMLGNIFNHAIGHENI